MKLTLINLLFFLTKLDLKGSGEESNVRPPPLKLPIDIPPESITTVEMSDGSEYTGVLQNYGRGPPPIWVLHSWVGQTVIYIRMPDRNGLAAELQEKIRPTRNEAPVPKYITVDFRNNTYAVATLRFFDRSRTVFRVDHNETRAYVGMPEGIIFSGYFRRKRISRV